MRRLPALAITIALFTVLISACSPKRYAINTVGDMLATGDSVYESDDDIIFIGEALPFSLKLVESLLIESPEHRGLLLTASRGYVLYAYAYIHYEAELASLVDVENARALRRRAKKFYLRGLAYGIRDLNLSSPGFEKALLTDPVQAVLQIPMSFSESDVPYLYWSAAALGLAISVSKNDPATLARMPEVEAMLNRALTLDEAWDRGTLHEFKIAWAAAQRTGASESILRQHFMRALELSNGERASLFVALAEAVSVSNQDRQEFQSLLETALAVNPDADPGHRLMNAIAHRRARWLLNRIDHLFL
jgi:predicted anti-sigma-YlaC factor YlaD